MTLKQKIYNHYLHVINDKITMLQKVLADLKESGSNETKSTAGDKHETSLAMLQIEQANVRTQVNDFFEKKAVLEKINPTVYSSRIINGSLVKTNLGYFFISIAAAKSVIDGINITALSAKSPLGKKLIGLTAGNRVEINNNCYSIEAIE